MRIQMNDGRVFVGTPVEIVGQMLFLAFGQEGRTLAEYMEWVVEQQHRLGQSELLVEGETVVERAASLVRAMLDAGLAEEVKG